MKTYFYLSRKRMNSKGLCPVYCRVASEKTRVDFSTGIMVNACAWDCKHGTAINNVNNVNTRLATIQSKVYGYISECERENIFDVNEVVARYRQQKQPGVFQLAEIAEEYIQVIQPPARVQVRMRIALSQFKKNDARKITADELKGFEAALLAKKFSPQTVFKKMQLLKRVFAYAVAKKYIAETPFIVYKLPRIPRIVLVHVTEPEINTLLQKEFCSERLAQVRDLFIFQCYTGLAYADLLQFSKAMVNGEYLKGKRCKTGEDFYLPFLKQAVTVANKYNYKLPVLSNQKYNDYLKEIANVCGIQKKLTTHVGRKTFAQHMINEGYSAESVAYMMGHASFNMTQKHYGRVGELRIEKEVLKMSG